MKTTPVEFNVLKEHVMVLETAEQIPVVRMRIVKHMNVKPVSVRTTDVYLKVQDADLVQAVGVWKVNVFLI